MTSVGALTLARTTTLFTRQVPARRRKAILTAAIFPVGRQPTSSPFRLEIAALVEGVITNPIFLIAPMLCRSISFWCLLEASGGEQDLRHTCQCGLVSDEMSIIADRRIKAAGGTCAIH